MTLLRDPLLPPRERLRDWLAVAGWANQAQDVLAVCDDQTVRASGNLEALERCYLKAYWRGERLEPDDLAGITMPPPVFLKLLGALLVPLVEKRHAALGLPAQVTEESCRNIGHTCAALAPFPGAFLKTLAWLGKYFRETMFKTGVFNYLLEKVSDKLPVRGFRRRADGRAVALAADGLPVDAQGLLCREPSDAMFVTRLEQSSRAITGNLVVPTGKISDRRVGLAVDEWETVLAPGLTTAGIHIPPGRPMLPEDCGRSLRDAASIIRRHLPDRWINCFTCGSWILNPDWLELLPNSNMARFMRGVYLFPLAFSLTAGVGFVFRKEPSELDLKTAPRRTRLQRIMLEKLEKGEPLRAGGMFLLLDDAEAFGVMRYQDGHDLPAADAANGPREGADKK